MASTVRRMRAQLRDYALSLPEAHEDLPWGERVVKVKNKVFVFLGRDMDAHFGLGVKLPHSHSQALELPFTAPTGYGLGKSGWVSAKLEADAKPSLELLRSWVLESYVAVAPKSLAVLVRAPALPVREASLHKATSKKARVKKTPRTGLAKKAVAAKKAGRAKSVTRQKPAVKRAPKR
jgi:predicted DNA-binding protein (MmcQ/YjbR family)